MPRFIDIDGGTPIAAAADARAAIGATEVGEAVFTAAAPFPAAAAIGAPSLRPAMHHDPSGSADGPIAADDELDAGTVFSNTGTKKIKFDGGRFVHDPAASSGASSAGYLQVELNAVVRSMRAQVAWEPSATGAVAFVIPSTLADWDYDAGTLPAAGVHLTAYGNGIWNVAVWNPNAGAAGHVDHSVQPGTATSFTLTVQTSTPASTQTTASIAADATAAAVKSAIEALSNVAVGEVTVTKSPSGNFGITWATGLGAVTLTATPTGGTMGMAAPLPTDPANTIDPVVAYGVGLTKYGEYLDVGRYATVRDGDLRWLEVFAFPETDEIIILFPDGTNSGVLRHPGIGLWNSSRAVFELFESNSVSVETPAVFGKIAADSQRVTEDSPVVDKPTVAAMIANSRPVTLYSGGNITTSNISVSGSIPPGTQWIELVCIAGGGGGGGGGCQPSGTAVNGGSGGGSGGVIREIVPASALGTTWAAVIGKAGLGGASISSTGTGNNGTDGTSTKWYSGRVVYEAYPGGKGNGGTSGATPAVAGNPGGPFATAGAGSGINGAVGTSGAQMYTALGNPGAAAGGGITTAPTANNGGAGGANLVRGYFGGTAGVVGGAAPGQGKDATATTITTTPAGIPGPGPGGGAASSSGAAQDGADAAGWGGGGAGGGASLNGNASGAGGDGKGGYLIAIAHFV